MLNNSNSQNEETSFISSINQNNSPSNIDIDKIINKLNPPKVNNENQNVTLNNKTPLEIEEIKYLCNTAKQVFMDEPVLLEISSPLNICGDTHGQFSDLLRLFEFGGTPPKTNYLFLGDYVDRGKNSVETICLLLAYKIKYKDNFFLLRGNHESDNINRVYGFYDECKRRYNLKIWKTFSDCFNCLPVSALIDDKILCMHGGISPDLTSLDQIRKIVRPTEVPDRGLLCDLLWSDPDKDVNGWGDNERGVSVTFSHDIVTKLTDKLELDLICRAHQVVEYGYEFFADRRLVTVFSAPNYCGQFDNAGAMMSVDENLMCGFKILKPRNIGSRVMSKLYMRSLTPPRKRKDDKDENENSINKVEEKSIVNINPEEEKNKQEKTNIKEEIKQETKEEIKEVLKDNSNSINLDDKDKLIE